jgi:hypothetical protein
MPAARMQPLGLPQLPQEPASEQGSSLSQVSHPFDGQNTPVNVHQLKLSEHH